MLRRLPIEKNLIPYSFDVVLSNRTYTFTFKYNAHSNRFSVDLSRSGSYLVRGEKIIYNNPLFEALQQDNNGNINEDFFSEILLPYDFSEEQAEVNFDNFYESVFVWILKREDVENAI